MHHLSLTHQYAQYLLISTKTLDLVMALDEKLRDNHSCYNST